ncbi:hypothetical protein [Pseudooceanicola sp. LIPI14-2-Ac024]|uniref:hypothetical protein n=1 Tax=Pseudooceanicola sp. LIPI14-2-Ac024 TaxID=3344875 RepID=UPI0035CEFCE7
MNTQALSRKEKRARIAKASKLYGIKGEESLALHQAYMALNAGDVRTALQLAHPVTQSHPGNIHGWIILGGAALNQREGKTAKAFFAQALDKAPADPVAIGGMAKAHVLEAEVEPAVALAAQAIRAGLKDVGLITLYLQLMGLMGRKLAALDVVVPAARRIDDAKLANQIGDMLLDVDETGKSVEWFEKTYRLDPAPDAHKVARLKGLLYGVKLAAAETYARTLLDEGMKDDTIALTLLTALRLQHKYDEVETLADTLEFATPEGFARSRGVLSNVRQDRGDLAGAQAAYDEATHVVDGGHRMNKAYGAYRLRAGDYAEGWGHFAKRFPDQQRKWVAAENSAPENLAGRDHVYLVSEQGVGDQLALMALLRLAPLPEGCRMTFVGDPRFGPLLDGNDFGLDFAPMESFVGTREAGSPGELVYLGDLVRYLAEHPAEARHGAFLATPEPRRDELRAKYEARAKGRPIIGVSWASRSLIGALRSIDLAEVVQTFPEGSLVVNLQYGDCAADLAAARAARPDLDFMDDKTVDQMADLQGFAAQIMALDRVVTIDNTTAHMCGALGHPDTHLLLPLGTELMWYWGLNGGPVDQWYGSLKTHIQQGQAGDWTAPLAELRALD